jgi:hypothetical protein
LDATQRFLQTKEHKLNGHEMRIREWLVSRRCSSPASALGSLVAHHAKRRCV